MIHFLQAVPESADSTLVTAIETVSEEAAQGHMPWDQLINQLISWSIEAGRHILLALVVYIVGHYLIKLLNYLLARFLDRRNIEASIQTFAKSFVSIMLNVLLAVIVISALGLNTTSLAALLASFGVAIGMALSGNLQNFAGGLVILFLKPYKIGDWVEAQGIIGAVQSIQIFHTVLLTADGKQIYVPNGSMSSGSIINYTKTPTRRVEWAIGIEYGSDVEQARAIVLDLLKADKRIQESPEPEVRLKELGSSSVDLIVRCWTGNDDYWPVMFEVREKIYNAFNENGIAFPFTQITVHQV